MKHLKFILITTIILLTTACGKSHDQAYTEADDEAMVECEEEAPLTSGEVPPPPPPAPALPTDRKLVTSGNVTFDVTQATVDSVSKKLNKLIAKYNGYKTEDSQHSWNYCSTAKIPAGNFYAFLDELNSIGGKMTHKTITVKDMTEHYSDIQSSIKSKEAALEQYRVLLKRANKISEIIEIQTKIDGIQEELDRHTQAKLNIDKMVAYSKLEIELRISDYSSADSDARKYEPSFGSRLADALSGSIDLIEAIIIAIFYIWPILIILGVIFYLIRKRRKNKQ